MMSGGISALVLLTGILSSGSQHTATPTMSAKKVTIKSIEEKSISIPGNVVGAWQINDQKGTHLLMLTERAGPSKSEPSNSNERTDLEASYYARSGKRWSREWVIKDGVDCPGLDHAANFFADEVTITDLDRDGIVEVTVPYRLFCGGGVDPSVLKIILREGEQKFAMRGTTIIVIPGEVPFGGEAQYEKLLSRRANKAFKRHMQAVREKVVFHKY